MVQSVLDHTKGVGDRHNVMIFDTQGLVFSKVVQDLNVFLKKNSMDLIFTDLNSNNKNARYTQTGRGRYLNV